MADQSLIFKDVSITSLASGDNLAEGLNGQRQFLQIENTGNANIGVNFSGPATGGTSTASGKAGIGNTATIAGSGTITIVPNGSLTLDHVVPQNPIVIAGTAGQPVTVVVA